MEKIRLQKFIADSGLMSRRAAEAEIEKEAERLAAQEDEGEKHVGSSDVVLSEAAGIAADYAMISSIENNSQK